MTSTTEKKTSFSDNIFKYFSLSRIFDKIAIEEGEKNAPDDLMKLIVEFSGDINRKSIGFYQIKVSYDYKRQNKSDYNNMMITDYNNRLNSNFITNNEKEKIRKYKEEFMKTMNIITEGKKNIKYMRYCEKCDKYYISLDSYNKITNHYNSKSHQESIMKTSKFTDKDFIKRSNLNMDKKIKKELSKYFKSYQYNYEFDNIKIEYYDEYYYRINDKHFK